MAMRLYDLTEQYNDLLDLLEVSDDREALQAMLDGLEDAFDSKVESIVKLIRSKAAERDAIDEERQRLANRAEKLNKEVDWLQSYIQREMERLGKEKVKSALFNITIANCPPAVNILSESNIPDKFYILQPAKFNLDKRTLLEALKSGEVVQGAEIIQRKRLSIK
jgi:predicted nuclease with TOPRIM domain